MRDKTSLGVVHFALVNLNTLQKQDGGNRPYMPVEAFLSIYPPTHSRIPDYGLYARLVVKNSRSRACRSVDVLIENHKKCSCPMIIQIVKGMMNNICPNTLTSKKRMVKHFILSMFEK